MTTYQNGRECGAYNAYYGTLRPLSDASSSDPSIRSWTATKWLGSDFCLPQVLEGVRTNPTNHRTGLPTPCHWPRVIPKGSAITVHTYVCAVGSFQGFKVCVWSAFAESLSCILPVCRRSSSASSYSFSEEPITGSSRTWTVTRIPQHCGAVQGTSPVKAEGVSIHLL